MPNAEEKYPNTMEKTLICTGSRDQAEAARKEIQNSKEISKKIVLTKQKNIQLKYIVQDAREELPENLNDPNFQLEGYSTPGIEKLHDLQTYMTTQ